MNPTRSQKRFFLEPEGSARPGGSAAALSRVVQTDRRRFRGLGILTLMGLAWLADPSLSAAQSERHPDPNPPRLSRTNLLQYRDPQGQIQPVRSPEDWLRRRAAILSGMQQVMGPLPGTEKRVPLAVQVQEVFDGGDHIRKRLTYIAEPGSRVPAYLCIPKSALGPPARPAPAVLCLHPTDDRFGHQVVLGLGGDYHCPYALELTRRGYVTLAPSYPLLANYQPDLKQLGYQSGTMKAIWDNLRALDLLASLPFVRTNAFAAIGHSLGGHNAVYTAVFDERIQVVVSCCGLDSYLDYMDGNIRGWTSQRYMPRLLDYKNLEEIPFDFHELIGALAPRPCLIIAPLGDTNFKWRSVDRIARAARQVYGLCGVSDRLRVRHPDCGHDFPEAMREEAYQLIDAVLRPEPTKPVHKKME